MAEIDVKGTIYWESGMPVEKSGRLEGAVVKYASGAKSGSVPTDDNGDFEITGIDDDTDLSLVLLHEQAQSKTVAKKAGDFSEHLDLRMRPVEGRNSQWIGGATLAALVVILIALVAVYFSSHESHAQDATAKYASLTKALKSLPRTLAEANDADLGAGLEEVRKARIAVDTLRSPTDSDLAGILDNIAAYKKSADAQNVDDLVAMTDDALSRLEDPERRYFWTGRPWIMVEAWAWGLLGILLAKIVRIGWYLRSSSYLAKGTWMHIAHVVATPFLALIAVLALSFVKLESEEQTIVDLSRPLFLVITACLLSTNPWGLWDFVLGRGEALREKAKTAA
jgi:hypothetical protein